MTPQPRYSALPHALPFWVSLAAVPVVWAAAAYGGWAILLIPFANWVLFSNPDRSFGLDTSNPDSDTDHSALFWRRLVTFVWPAVEAITLFSVVGWMVRSGHLETWEMFGVAFGLGILSGAIGIAYAHELMHRAGKLKRWLTDLLMTMTLYGNFRSEHLLVHHRYVGTPRDAVTARYNRSFHHFFKRVLRQYLVSSWKAEKAKLARKGLRVWDRSNPYWRCVSLSTWPGCCWR